MSRSLSVHQSFNSDNYECAISLLNHLPLQLRSYLISEGEGEGEGEGGGEGEGEGEGEVAVFNAKR